MKTFRAFSFLILLIFSLNASLIGQSVLNKRAYGVWSRGGTEFSPGDPNYDFLVGLEVEGGKWSEIQPEDSSSFDWSSLQRTIDIAAERGQFIYLGIGVGPESPAWIYENGVQKVYTNDTDHERWLYYPYYIDPDYVRYQNKLIEALAGFLYSQPPEKLQCISFIQVKTGCTGDEVAYKGEPLDSQYALPKSGQEWINFRLAVFEKYRESFLTREPKIPLLFNDVREADFPEAWNWIMDNIGSDFGIKEGALVRGHHLTNEKIMIETWKPYLIDPDELALFNRSEMDQTWKKPFYQVNQELGFYWGVINGLNQGLSINDLSGSALEEMRDNETIQNAYRLFDRYANQIYPENSEWAFVALHEGLDASDTEKFPENKYGIANKNNEERYEAICNDPVYANRGARMDDIYAATRGQVYQRNYQTGYNDAGWEIWPTNYSRFISQIDPEETSIGLFRIGGQIDSRSPKYARFARSFESRSGKNAMYFRFHEDFCQGDADTVTFVVVYFDKENGSSWELHYDAGPGDMKSAFSITCNGSNTWKTQTVTVPDAVLNQNGYNKSDFALVNTDTKDDIFHMIEVKKGYGRPLYKKSNNAFLSSIQWPDISDSISSENGWINKVIPGFDKNKLSYIVHLPAGFEDSPALAVTTEDVNATIDIQRPANLQGTLEERTSRINVVAENGKTKRTYSVTYIVDNRLGDDRQPFEAEPFFSRLVYREFFNNNYIEISNPGKDSLDMSYYLIAMANEQDADQIISDDLPFEKRYNYYVPGYDYASMDTFLYQPGIIVRDSGFNPFVEPGGSFVIGHIEDPDPEDRVHVNDCDVIINADLSFDTDVKLIVAGPDAITKNGWMNGVLCLYRILNDSVRNGTKAISDPNDFLLVDVFGTYDGSSWAPAGNPLLDEDNKWNIIRKAQFWHGDSHPGTEGSWGVNEEESEWICISREDYIAMGYGGYDAHLKLSENIGNHLTDPVTDYKSTITSKKYKVSEGYESPQQISKIPEHTTFLAFLSNIIRRNAEQKITLQANNGSLKGAEDEIVSGDSLVVTSADGQNETRYGLLTGADPLSSDARLLAKEGSGLTIVCDSSKASIIGVQAGSTLSRIRENIIIPQNARLCIVDENNNLVPLQMLTSDGLYIPTTAHENHFFEVTAEDNVTKILYQLQFEIFEEEAYAWSDIYNVNQESNTITKVPGSIIVSKLFENLKPNPGSDIKLLDRAGLERITGPVDWEDYVLVTSASGNVQREYLLNFAGEILGSDAYINSKIYDIDQDNLIVDSILIETTVNEFLQNITAAPYADILIMNADKTPVSSGMIDEGFSVLVTSGDGLNEVRYSLKFYSIFLETEAYVTSETYSINQTTHTIDSVPPQTPVNEFLRNIKPARNAGVEILDENQNPVYSGYLDQGYQVHVTSEDGLAEAFYTVNIYEPVPVLSPTLNSIRIYPNPFGDRLIVEGLSRHSRIILSNTLGNIILKISNGNAGKIGIDAANLKAGLYIIRVQGKRQTYVSYKIIKK